MGRWEEIDHTADLALRLWGEDLADLFGTAARGMFSLIADLDAVAVEDAVSITLTALDVEMLLVDWLNELLYLHERDGLAFKEFAFVQITPTRLEARASGGGISRYRNYVKAATFHNLNVAETGAGYETEIVFDT